MNSDALVSMESVARTFRAVGLLILDLLGAVVVPAMLEGTVWRLIPVHSVAAIVVKEWCLSLPCAAFMGFMMYRFWRSGTSKWVWVLPALLFALWAIPYATRSHTHSVFLENSGFWFHFSGAACAADVSNCRDFYAFTVPLVRALSYSGAALLASRVLRPPLRAEVNSDTTTSGNEEPNHA
jgi:hypothetical protein